MKLGVGAVVLWDGKILLVKRRFPPSRGYWSIPGGHVKPGETFYDTAVRELLEETGLAGSPRCVVGVDELLVYDGNGVLLKSYVLIDVLVEVLSGFDNLRAGSDAADVRFMKLVDVLRDNRVSLSTKSFVHRIFSLRAERGDGDLCGMPLVRPFRTVLFES